MGKLFVTFAVVGCCLLLSGCGRTYDGDQRFPLSGSATFEGEPIDLGSISLIPAGGGATAGGGGRATGGVIHDGKYLIPEERGPNAGTYRVEVHWLKRTGKQLRDLETGDLYDERVEALPKKFHLQSDLTVEIPATENTHDLNLTAG